MGVTLGWMAVVGIAAAIGVAWQRGSDAALTALDALAAQSRLD